MPTNKISFYSLKIIGFIFSKNFKTIVESSLIAHSIGNFILKNIKTEHFLIKMTCDEIWRHMSLNDVSLGVKIGVLDSPLKRVKNGKFYNCDTRNRILIKFWFRNIYFGFLSAFAPTKKIGLKKNKKRIPCFLAIFENFEHRFGPLKIKIFQIRKKH